MIGSPFSEDSANQPCLHHRYHPDLDPDPRRAEESGSRGKAGHQCHPERRRRQGHSPEDRLPPPPVSGKRDQERGQRGPAGRKGVPRPGGENSDSTRGPRVSAGRSQSGVAGIERKENPGSEGFEDRMNPQQFAEKLDSDSRNKYCSVIASPKGAAISFLIGIALSLRSSQ